jgi:hypothetical protein
MYPYTRIGISEVSIIDFHTGIVVPESDVGYGHFDYGYESISLAEPAFVEFFYMLKRYVQAAPKSAIQEC